MINKAILYSVVTMPCLVIGAATVQAGDAPTGNIASAKVYKVIAENAEWRILEGIWQPGQEDHLHSHPDGKF